MQEVAEAPVQLEQQKETSAEATAQSVDAASPQNADGLLENQPDDQEQSRDDFIQKIIAENPTLSQANEEVLEEVKKTYENIPLAQLEQMANQKDTLIQQIIDSDPSLSELDDDALDALRQGYKGKSVENLQDKLSDVQDKLLESGEGIQREGLASPNLTEQDQLSENKEQLSAYELEDKWFGKDGKEGGLIRDAIKANYYAEFRDQILADEEEIKKITERVQADYSQKHLSENNELSLQEYFAENEAAITVEVQQKLQEKIDESVAEKVEEKFKEVTTEGVKIDQFIEIITNESLEDSFDENGNPTEEKKKKNKAVEFFKQLAAGLGNFTVEGVASSDIGTLFRLLFSADAASLHRSAFENSKSLEGKTAVDDEAFKKLVLRNKEGNETTTQAYNKVFTKLGESYVYLTNTKNSETDILTKELSGDDLSTEAMQQKAKVLYELFYDQVNKKQNAELVNQVFRRTFNESDGLKGEFSNDYAINGKVFDLLYSFKDISSYNKLMSET